MMTVEDIRAHAEQLQSRLETERKRVETGHYAGQPEANLELITALDGRISELLAQCTLLESRAQEAAAVLVA